jgi:formamidopyrimidine-DNA glycosylase
MPELPEVEIVRRGLAGAMLGHRIVKVKLKRQDLRFPLPQDFASRVEGRTVQAVDRRAKYIIATLSGGESLLMHLGMSGRFTIFRIDGKASNLGEFHLEEAAGAGGRGIHDHVVFMLDDGTSIVYTDPRRFGVMDLVPAAELGSHRLMKHLGVEPLGTGLTTRYLARAFAGRAAPLKAALLDQKLVAGLGNIYVCEALFRSGLSPTRRAGTLVKNRKNDRRLGILVREIRRVLNRAIDAGGSTLRDYAGADGTVGSYQHRFSVYDRLGKPCLRRGCTGTIRRLIQAGRSTFYCPVCQR